MTDQAQRTTWAVQRFESFVNAYTPPAMQVYCRDGIANVQRAIRAIAPPMVSRVVGYAVFAEVPDRERDCGFEHIAISAISETLAGAENVMAGNIKRAEKYLSIPPQERERQLLGGSVVRLDEIDRYVICAVQQVPT